MRLLFDAAEDGPEGSFAGFLARVLPADRPQLEAAVARALDGRAPYRAEYRVAAADGGVRWLEARGEVRRDAAGRPVEVIGVTLDVTKRKVAEEELRKSRERLLQALAAGGQVAWETDLATLTYRIEAGAPSWLGWPIEALPRTREAFLALIHPEDRASLSRNAGMLARGELPGETAEYRLRAADGAYRWVRSSVAVVERDADGRPLRLIATTTDIDARRRAELALEATSRRLALALEAGGAAVWEADLDQGTLAVDATGTRRLGLGAGPRTLALAEQARLIHPEDRPRFAQALAAVRDGTAAALELEQRMLRPDGSSYWIHVRGEATERDAAGKALRLLGVSVDVTAGKAAQLRLEASERRLRLALDAGGFNVWEYAIATGDVTWKARYPTIFGELGSTIRVTEAQILEATHPEDRAAAAARFAAFRAGAPGPLPLTYRVRLPEGGWRWVENVGEVTERDGEGRGRRALGVFRDVSALKEAELAARARLAELEALYDQAPLALALVDPELRYVRVNARLAALNGLPAAAHVGRSVWEVAPRVRRSLEPRLRQVLATGEPVRDLERASAPTAGRPHGRHWLQQLYPVKAVDGRVVALGAIVQDITERKQAEEKLRASEGALRLALQAGRAVAWGRDLEAGILWHQAAGLAELGLLFPAELSEAEWLARVPPEERPATLARLERQRAGDRGEFLSEHRLRLDDGRQAWFATIGRVVEWDAAGRGRKVLGIAVDVTERKAAELAAQARLAELEALYGQSPVGLALLDKELRFVRVNPSLAAMDGRSVAEHLGRQVWDVVPALRPILEPAFQQVLATGERVTDVAISGETPSLPGVRRDWLAQYYPLKDEAGRVAAVGAIVEEVTERRRIERALAALNASLEEQVAQRTAELVAANAAKDAFLATMSHEIRTPLTAVLGMADLLAAEGLDDRQRQRIQAIHASGRHLLDIVNDILDFSRVEAGELALERVDFTLLEIVEHVRSLLAPQAVERGLDLRLDLDGGMPPILRGDPTRLRQVLINLVGNALKFTTTGGVAVRVSCAAEGGPLVRVRFEVQDTGIGMTPEQVAGLFRPFAQADRSITRRYGGSGLGLAICRRLVEAMGGAIGVESVPGAGSLFWFELPLEPGDPVAAAGRAGLDAATLRPLRLLVADDVPLNRDLLREMLARHGHRVETVGDGAQAVACAGRERFDAILLDVHMPVMDGIEAARSIRRLPPPAGRVPIVGLTAGVTEGERHRYAAAGMDGCVAKPVSWPELFAALAAVTNAAPAAAGPTAKEAAAAAAGQLLDQPTIDTLAEMLPGPTFADLLRQGVADAGRSARTLRGLAADLPRLLQEAHSLKGTSGSFGLMRVSRVAGEIEAAAKDGGAPGRLLDDLDEALAASEQALRAGGLLAQSG